MKELKNCPNCGGVLDDNGRCLYCKSKVYDLTDIDIDIDSRDIILIRFRDKDYVWTMKAFPVSINMTSEMPYTFTQELSGVPHYVSAGQMEHTINLELRAFGDYEIKEKKDEVLSEL